MVPNIAHAFVVLQTVYSNRKLIFLACELNDLRCFCSPFMLGSKQREEAKQMSSPFAEPSCKKQGRWNIIVTYVYSSSCRGFLGDGI